MQQEQSLYYVSLVLVLDTIDRVVVDRKSN